VVRDVHRRVSSNFSEAFAIAAPFTVALSDWFVAVPPCEHARWPVGVRDPLRVASLCHRSQCSESCGAGVSTRSATCYPHAATVAAAALEVADSRPRQRTYGGRKDPQSASSRCVTVVVNGGPVCCCLGSTAAACPLAKSCTQSPLSTDIRRKICRPSPTKEWGLTYVIDDAVKAMCFINSKGMWCSHRRHVLRELHASMCVCVIE
jgi:hypothetical protein